MNKIDINGYKSIRQLSLVVVKVIFSLFLTF